jgi:hypothetical protein
MTELCDLIYQNPVYSKGVKPDQIPEDWVMEKVGGVEIYVKTSSKDALQTLRQAMLDAHPDRTGTDTTDQFVSARQRYLEAVKRATR